MQDLFGAELISYPNVGENYATRSVSSITDFIIHHSAGGTEQSPLDINAEHQARGMAMIAYNWVIEADGTLVAGRPIGWVSAASYGRNPQSVSVCLLGNFELLDPGYTGDPTPQQVEALKTLCLKAHQHITSISRTYGHKDLARLFYGQDQAEYSTACPGSELEKLIPDVKNYVTENLHAKL